MSDLTATPETGTVDAPASMDSVLAEFEAGNAPPESDAVDDAVRELVSEAEGGQPDEGADEEVATETVVEGEPQANTAEAPSNDLDLTREVTVKVDGQEVKVPLGEALQGYSREADYTKKTKALADERRGLEATVSEKYANDLEQATQRFVQLDPLLAEARNIDWPALAQADPATYTQLRAQVDARVEAIRAAEAEVARVRGEQATARETQVQEGIAATEKAIRASDPRFADDAVFTAHVSDTVGELRGLGLDSDMLTAVLSNPDIGPQVLSLIADARELRAQRKAKAALPDKRVVPAPQAKALRADASDGSKSTRRAPSSNASRDAKVSYAVAEILEGMDNGSTR